MGCSVSAEREKETAKRNLTRKRKEPKMWEGSVSYSDASPAPRRIKGFTKVSKEQVQHTYDTDAEDDFVDNIDPKLRDFLLETSRSLGLPAPAAEDRRKAEAAGTRLLYGEILPTGVSRMMASESIDLSTAKVLLDIGSGRGLLAVQVFAQFPTLDRVIGVEVSSERYKMSMKVTSKFETFWKKSGNSVTRTVHENETRHFLTAPGETKQGRSLEFYQEDVGKLSSLIREAGPDIVVMDVAFADRSIPSSILKILKSLKPGVMVLSFEDLKSRWPVERHGKFPFKEGGDHHDGRKYSKGSRKQDSQRKDRKFARLKTSWSTGAWFHTWKKIAPPSSKRTTCSLTSG
mmetsp:Transcript_14211/g.21593  ORF Transcript_14211/g.21593 Transcript_14211/m.21593 type:complete len:346 (+) Transcript_14211:125-1162(+)